MKRFTLFSEIGKGCKQILSGIRDSFLEFGLRFSSSSKRAKASFFVMGLGQILYKQYI